MRRRFAVVGSKLNDFIQWSSGSENEMKWSILFWVNVKIVLVKRAQGGSERTRSVQQWVGIKIFLHCVCNLLWESLRYSTPSVLNATSLNDMTYCQFIFGCKNRESRISVLNFKKESVFTSQNKFQDKAIRASILMSYDTDKHRPRFWTANLLKCKVDVKTCFRRKQRRNWIRLILATIQSRSFCLHACCLKT
jgi:hypothetical protein